MSNVTQKKLPQICLSILISFIGGWQVAIAQSESVPADTATCEQIYGFDDCEVSGLAAIGDELYAGLIGSSMTYVTEPNGGVIKWDGSSWSKAGDRPGSGRVSSLAAVGDKLYAGTLGIRPPSTGVYQPGGVYQWDDGIWKVVMEGTSEYQDVWVLGLHAMDNKIYVGTEQFLYEVDTRHNDWREIANYGVICLDSKDNHLYFGTKQSTVFRLNVETEELLDMGKPGGDHNGVTDIASMGAELYASSLFGVYKWNESGDWVRIDEGTVLDGKIVYTFLAVNTTLYAGTATGVYQLNTSEPNGTWSKVGSLSQRIETMMIMDDIVYAGTAAGVYYLQDDWKFLN